MTVKTSPPANSQQNADAAALPRKSFWWMGFLGSDLLLLLAFLSLVYLRKLMPPEDYREFRSIWFGFVAPSAIMIAVASVFGFSVQTVLICKIVGALGAGWLFYVVWQLRMFGVLSQKIFVPRRDRRLPMLLVGLVFFGMSSWLFSVGNFNGIYDLISSLFASMMGFMLSGRLFKSALIANREKFNE